MMKCEWCGEEGWDGNRDFELLRWPWPTPHSVLVCRTCRDILLRCLGFERRQVRRAPD